MCLVWRERERGRERERERERGRERERAGLCVPVLSGEREREREGVYMYVCAACVSIYEWASHVAACSMWVSQRQRPHEVKDRSVREWREKESHV